MHGRLRGPSSTGRQTYVAAAVGGHLVAGWGGSKGVTTAMVAQAAMRASILCNNRRAAPSTHLCNVHFAARRRTLDIWKLGALSRFADARWRRLGRAQQSPPMAGTVSGLFCALCRSRALRALCLRRSSSQPPAPPPPARTTVEVCTVLSSRPACAFRPFYKHFQWTILHTQFGVALSRLVRACCVAKWAHRKIAKLMRFAKGIN
jgi:hypothetical protein